MLTGLNRCNTPASDDLALIFFWLFYLMRILGLAEQSLEIFTLLFLLHVSPVD